MEATTEDHMEVATGDHVVGCGRLLVRGSRTWVTTMVSATRAAAGAGIARMRSTSKLYATMSKPHVRVKTRTRGWEKGGVNTARMKMITGSTRVISSLA
jgi:hypothetical protein